jgi:ribosome-associated protein
MAERQPVEMNAREKAELAARLILERKAEEVLLLHVGPLVGYTDYFLLASGKSARQVQALSQHLQEEMKKRGMRPLGVEGEAEGSWVLLDFEEVIVHVFYEPVRRFYDLEGLWADAPKVDLLAEEESPKTEGSPQQPG